MQIKLEDAAEVIGGKIYGNKDLVINNLAKIEEAKSGDLTFLYLSSYEKYFADTKAAAILVNPGLKSQEMILLMLK